MDVILSNVSIHDAGKIYNVYNDTRRNMWRIDVTTNCNGVRIDTNTNVE